MAANEAELMKVCDFVFPFRTLSNSEFGNHIE